MLVVVVVVLLVSGVLVVVVLLVSLGLHAVRPAANTTVAIKAIINLLDIKKKLPGDCCEYFDPLMQC